MFNLKNISMRSQFYKIITPLTKKKESLVSVAITQLINFINFNQTNQTKCEIQEEIKLHQLHINGLWLQLLPLHLTN